MNDTNVTSLPSARSERPLFGLRPEDALRYMLQELVRVLKLAEYAVVKPARGYATPDELAHLSKMYTRGELICQMGHEAFPFSSYPFKQHRDVYKAHAERAHALFVDAVRREAEIALNCKKAAK